MKDEALSIDGRCIEQLPIAAAKPRTREQIHGLTENLLGLADRMVAVAKELEEKVGTATGADLRKSKPSELVRLPVEAFLERMTKVCGVKNLDADVVSTLMKAKAQALQEQAALLSQQLELERKLESQVEDAYGLNEEERMLLRQCRTTRDPQDVLAGKVAQISAATGVD